MRPTAWIVPRCAPALVATLALAFFSGCATSPRKTIPSSFLIPSDSWDAVQRLPWGQEVFVGLVEGGEVEGTFESATSEAAVIRTGDGSSRTIAAEVVSYVDLRVVEPSSKGKLTRRGALIGGALGLSFTLLACELGDADCDIWTGITLIIPATAAIGALWGRSAGQPSRVSRTRIYARAG